MFYPMTNSTGYLCVVHGKLKELPCEISKKKKKSFTHISGGRGPRRKLSGVKFIAALRGEGAGGRKCVKGGG